MTTPTPARPRTVDASALIWGLIFLAAATLGLVRGLGQPVNWQLVGILAPVALIALGVLGLTLNRFQTR
ncbi:hypothetical protein IPV09_09285 [Tessaracoccus sp. SD287]|uniref:hypothetical protein n=1 Tax=Tessaracoccus sp. SD287 TaxID=2782008 RepID=UPI001A971251|nr:hypothetical protein [Tessaracoccus sp. SD287]MBO1031527.1 hypothetical protein [Tessaracoccus sp. SD287]